MKKIIISVLTVLSFLVLMINSVFINANGFEKDNDINVKIEAISGPKDNELYFWNSDMKNYNCYAYSIGLITDKQPGNLWGASNNVSTIADRVVNDLKVLTDLSSRNFSNVKKHDSIPQLPSSAGKHLIAVRTGHTTLENKNEYDYHFMRYDLKEKAWLHKPGGTAILKLKGSPDDYQGWNGEIYSPDKGGSSTNWFSRTFTYDSPTIYISFEGNLTFPAPVPPTPPHNRHTWMDYNGGVMCAVCGKYQDFGSSWV